MDDDDLIRKLLVKLLSHLGCLHLHEATSAREALDLLQRSPPRLVLTDLCMETNNAGLHVARAATSQRIAVAIVSGQPESLPPDLAHVPWLEKDRLSAELLERLIGQLIADQQP